MKDFFLTKIRLSVYFWVLFAVFLLLSYALPGNKFDASALTLFSVNSFLYGFYISPILVAQKNRIDDLHRTVRAESNALFSLVLRLKRLPDDLRNHLQAMVKGYIQAKLHNRGVNGGEKEYEALITYCVEYKGSNQADVDKVLEMLITNQQNRTNFNMQAANKVYNNEWHIMTILFAITMGFILMLQLTGTPLLHIVRALLCTGLAMLMLILVKLSTLTHKRAQLMWAPLQKLLSTNFYRTD